MSRGIKLGSSGVAGGGGTDRTGTLICDTSTLTVGDTIRVRSLINSSVVFEGEVETVGDPVIFEVPSRDYYKICLVQDISGTPTEVTSIDKTVDDGQTLFINVLDKLSLSGIQNILNAHSELSLLNIGDEINIHVGGVEETFIIAALNLYADHEVIFVKKYVLNGKVSIPISTGSDSSYPNTALRASCLNFYNSIDITDRVFIKQKTVTFTNHNTLSSGWGSVIDYCFAPTAYELGLNDDSISVQEKNANYLYPLFSTNANRAKTTSSGTAAVYASASHALSTRWCEVTTSGAVTTSSETSGTKNYYVLPCFHLTADV